MRVFWDGREIRLKLRRAAGDFANSNLVFEYDAAADHIELVGDDSAGVERYDGGFGVWGLGFGVWGLGFGV